MVEIIVFDFDGTLMDLNVKWDNLTDSNRRKLESEATRNRILDFYTRQVLEALKSRYRLAIYSRNLTDTIKEVLNRSGIYDIFVVGRDQYVKPDVKGLEHIADFYGYDNLVMVGDSWHDVKVAKDYGCPCIIVENKKLSVRPEGADLYIKALYG